MLELDLVLEPFVNGAYEGLCAADRQRFRELMACEDQDLYAWLMQRAEPPDKELALIVGTILRFTHTPPGDR